MQKIRQQHQHLNHKTNASHSNTGANVHNNNSNNANNKTHYGSHVNVQRQQQQQQPNNAQQAHGMTNMRQQHHQQQATHRNNANAHAHQQHQHQSTHAYNTQPMKNHAPSNSALKQILPTNAIRPPSSQQHPQMQQQHQQQFGYNYAAGSKPKYNNNNNKNNATMPNTTATFSTPKAILQNPNRVAKPPITPQNSVSSITTTTATKAKESNDQTADSIKSKPISKDKEAVAKDDLNTKVNADSENSTAQSENSPQQTASNTEANKENISADSNECGNDTSNNILCNDDSIAKNSKEKTPMCLVNELARYNKITHQYRLTGEKGPAHSKRFTVTLKLGNEEYTAEGFKIKKAQHAAATQALEKTAYKHPIPKAIRNHDDGKPRPYIMPTVELNALAMKLGQQTYYLYDPRQIPPPVSTAEMHEHTMHDANMPVQHFGGGTRGIPLPPNGAGHLMPLPPQQRLMNDAATYGPRRHFDGGFCGAPVPPPPPQAHMPNCPPQRPYGPPHRGGFPMMNRYRYPMMPPTAPVPPGMPPHMHHPHYGMLATPYKITLIVGNQKFIGSGRTLQHAKHDAAAKALQVLKTQKLEEPNNDLDESMDENDIKSPISQVHEAGIKRNLTVHFKIIREDGPAHMRNFITACIMGSMITEGEGHGKKISKKRAAEKMLHEIKKLPPVSTPQKTPTKRTKTKTPSKLEGKVGKDLNESGERDGRSSGKREKFAAKERVKKTHEAKEKSAENEEECPVTKLLQLMQKRKQKEPVFEFIAKSGSGEKTKRREFIVEVTAQGYAARGTGANKKIAKRNAAENLLHTLLEGDNLSSDNEATEEQVDIDDDDDDDDGEDDDDEPAVIEITKKHSPAAAATKNNAKEFANVKSTKILDSLELPNVSTGVGQVPGILILRQNKKSTAAKKKDPPTTNTVSSTPSRPVKAAAKRIDLAANDSTENVEIATGPKDNAKAAAKPKATKITAAEAEEEAAEEEQTVETATKVTTTSNSNATTTSSSTTSSSTAASNGAAASSMMKQQLLYLANLLGFEVNFSDFPKGNHNEFLTIVALSTDPPQMCHGFGQNTNESQNDAARNALKILSDLGLNNAKSN